MSKTLASGWAHIVAIVASLGAVVAAGALHLVTGGELTTLLGSLGSAGTIGALLLKQLGISTTPATTSTPTPATPVVATPAVTSTPAATSTPIVSSTSATPTVG